MKGFSRPEQVRPGYVIIFAFDVCYVVNPRFILYGLIFRRSALSSIYADPLVPNVGGRVKNKMYPITLSSYHALVQNVSYPPLFF